MRGKLLELRPLRTDEFDLLFDAAKDPLIWEQHPDSDRYQREVFKHYFESAIASKGAFAIIDRASGRIIGSSRYCNLNEARREVEIGWTFLERAYWGGHYNRELKSLMLDHAFGSRIGFSLLSGKVICAAKKRWRKSARNFFTKPKCPTATRSSR